MVTCCEMFSVDVLPLPPSHAFHDPVRAGRLVLFVIGPDVPVQPTAPDSKPGLARRLLPDGGVVVGEAAEQRGASDPSRLVREFKRRVGDPVPLVVGGAPYSAQARPVSQ